MARKGSSRGSLKATANEFVRAALALLDPDRVIEGLDPEVRTKFRALVLVIAMVGLGKIRVVCGRRSLHEQEVLWGRGRTPENCRSAVVDPSVALPLEGIVTWTLPKYSRHVAGMAIDIDLSEYEVGSYPNLGHAARSVGVKWGGDWGVKDYGHFEV